VTDKRLPDILFFEDEDEAPRLPHEVEITEVQVRPLPDGRRVVIQVALTPFIESPSFDVTILRPDGTAERTLSVVSTMDRMNTLTMHLRWPERLPEYVARVELVHAGAVLQTREVRFSLPARPTPTDEP
jgi:hypothetical protein